MSWKNWLTTKYGNLSESVKRYKNKDFMDAVVAGCALVAAADGKFDASEKQKMAGYIGRSEELRIFDMNEVITRFNFHTSNFEFDHIIGKAEALKVIGKYKSDREGAKLLVGVCCAIGGADGDFDDDEKNMVREICRALDLPPADFQL